ncbi:C-C motif chemokine 38a.3 isoform X2 [Danio rerio]|uniref:C-C motif chemokine n=1 Tax=Danio rerio TaxID=7955 RepID=A0AB32TC07_DANRE
MWRLCTGSQGPVKCCYSFFNARIPVKEVGGYHATHLQCNINAVIFITKAQREICTNPAEKWVQRLMRLVDVQNMKQMTEGRIGDSLDTHRSKPLHEMPKTNQAVSKKAEIITMTEMPLQQQDETTSILYYFQDWTDFDTTQANSKTDEHTNATSRWSQIHPSWIIINTGSLTAGTHQKERHIRQAHARGR